MQKGEGENMELQNISTLKLIEELNSRDLFAELSEEKQAWLKDNGFRENKLDFINIARKGNIGYGLDYFSKTPLDQIIFNDNKIKSMT